MDNKQSCDMVIYHNPRCRKSREALQMISKHGVEVSIIEYLKDPPSKGELKELIKKLGIPAVDLIRKGESLYKESYKGKALSDEEWIRIMTENPILIERPIIVKGNRAVLGRPPENVLKLLA